MPKLSTIVKFLDKELLSETIQDSSNNGLQAENTGAILKVCCGVDASLEFFEAAKKKKADLLICHHGISWGDSLKRITERNYKYVSYLIRNNMALYACHLPLDAHRQYGNNALIAKALGLKRVRGFGVHGDIEIGVEGKFPKPMRYDHFKKLVQRTIGKSIQTMDFGKKTIQTVAVVSGGAAGDTEDAGKKGIDVYLTGEPLLTAYSVARDYGINVVFAGHYATEVFGVRALGKLLKRKFMVDAEFIDLNVPF
ncbi:MAG: Nif3-like dinuclear metal center hexameric protein [Kiritimatiellae bacterium]|nr:Nif3-like dinuclear metal center hexameric protein [Kiritimatiellia bacterium]